MNANEIKHYAMYQGPMTNNFLSMLYLRPSSINSLTGEAKICSGDFTMYIDNYELHMQSEVFVMKIFDFFTVLFTGRYGYRKDEPFDIISYSLKNIALIFGIKKTEASANMLRVKIKRAFELLKSVSLEWKESPRNV
jgi:hypothetical protein